MAILNLGILAHVDAGKTTLTERILFETGVIHAAGSVDKGTTQTDTLELERARGITIKSAVVSFPLHGLTVNLIDTPGHADFIAEASRSLDVLDAVVLVISAVEGVQPQTRRLARAVREAGLPLLIFVNKIDRLGARGESLLAEIQRRLKLRVVAMNAATSLGSRSAAVLTCNREDPVWRERLTDLLAETDDRIIDIFERTGGELSASFIEDALRAQIAASAVVPVFFGSAITGAGIADLLAGIAEWLPARATENHAPVAGTIFKIARRPTGEKLVYARLFAGALAVRQQVAIWRPDHHGGVEQFEERITGIDRFAGGAARPAESAETGEIVLLHGLRTARIGDRIGEAPAYPRSKAQAFPAPALESTVLPLAPGDITRLRAALEELAEQDPLISLRQRNDAGEITLCLYGEVQKEVMAETLARDYGIGVSFGPTRTICIERPIGTGEAVELIDAPENPFAATVGFRIKPAACGSGIRYVRELGSLPPAFYRAIEETVYETLRQGLHGWEVTDCVVTLTQVGYWSPVSTAGDFRKLTPLVLMQALLAAGTAVHEPVETLEIEIPEEAFGAVCGLLPNARAVIENAAPDGPLCHIICRIPTAELREVERCLSRLTRGEGDWGSAFAGYGPVQGNPPARPRVGPNPLNRADYLRRVTGDG